MRPTCRGFTIVESVVVVVAIGLVAAVVWPQIGQAARNQREQRMAKLQSARSSVQSAAALIHGVATARLNQPQESCVGVGFGANPPLVNLAGNGNLCTENGRVQVALLYPAATTAGIVASAGLVPVAGTPTVTQLGYEGLRVAAHSRHELQIQASGGPDAANCAFTYRAPARLGEAAAVSAVVTSGC